RSANDRGGRGPREHGRWIAVLSEYHLRLVLAMQQFPSFVKEPSAFLVDTNGHELIFVFVHRFDDIPCRYEGNLMLGRFPAEQNRDAQFLFHGFRALKKPAGPERARWQLFSMAARLSRGLFGQGLRSLLVDDLDRLTRIAALFELQNEVFRFHRIPFVVESNSAGNTFEVLQFPDR